MLSAENLSLHYGCSVGHESAHRLAKRGLGYVPQGRDVFALLKDMVNRRGGNLSGGSSS